MLISKLARKCVALLTIVVVYLIAVIAGLFYMTFIIKIWVKHPLHPFWKKKTRPVPPKCLNDPRLGNHSYIQTKDVKLHYVEKGDQSLPLMLCLHGFPEFWYSWRHQLTHFSSQYWVVAVDMRGYGDSDKPAGVESYKTDHLIGDIKSLITALGREKCTLVAHDWGGIVAWYLVLLEPQMFDSYVIMNSVHPIAFGKVLKERHSQRKKSWYTFFFLLPYLPELLCQMDDLDFPINYLKSEKTPSLITEMDIEAYKFTFGKPGALTPPINYYRASYLMSSSHQLKGLGQGKDLPPGLILYGDGDLFIDREVQEETVRLVSNTTLVCVPGANHFVQQDDPAAVNTLMSKFFIQLQLTRRNQ